MDFFDFHYLLLVSFYEFSKWLAPTLNLISFAYQNIKWKKNLGHTLQICGLFFSSIY